MQVKRHKVDYDPTIKLVKSEVQQDLSDAQDVIQRTGNVQKFDRRAFAAHVLFAKRSE